MSRMPQLKALLEKEPDDTFLLFALAMEHVAATEWDDALAGFDRVIELEPNNDTAYFQKAKVQIEMGRRHAAGKTLAAGMKAAKETGDQHAYDKMAELLGTLKPR